MSPWVDEPLNMHESGVGRTANMNYSDYGLAARRRYANEFLTHNFPSFYRVSHPYGAVRCTT